MSNTAGKGPGIVYRAANGSGTVGISTGTGRRTAKVQILDDQGRSFEVSLSADELQLLARTLHQVAAALLAASRAEEVTQ